MTKSFSAIDIEKTIETVLQLVLFKGHLTEKLVHKHSLQV